MPDGIIAAADQVAPQLEIARAFVAALTGSPDTPIRVRMIHDLKAREHQSVEAIDTIERLWTAIVEFQRRGYGCFYFLNETEVPEGRQYARDADVTAIHALAIDADADLPDELAWHCEPSVIVQTSRSAGQQRGQMLWRVSDCPVADFGAAQARLAAYYRSDATITNPSRVLRLPGTLHLKDPENPQLVTILPGRPGAAAAG